LPRVARNMQDMALVRSMSSREGDHGRATFYLRTGYLPQGPVQYPTLGALLSRELGLDDAPLPNFVSIAPFPPFNPAASGPGLLGPQYPPTLVGDMPVQPNAGNDYERSLQVQALQPPADVQRPEVDARIGLLQDMERDFVARHPGVSAQSHQSAYDRAVRLMRTAA